MQPYLAVLALSESFEAVWPRLASSLGLELRSGRSIPELEPLESASGIVLAVGGAEAAAVEILRSLAPRGLPAPCVVGAETDHRLVATLLHSGAADYFALPGELGLLRSWMAVRADRAAAQHLVAENLNEEREQNGLGQILGKHPALKASLARVRKVSQVGSGTVLLTGESGTGKELFAQAIHYEGPRAGQPFVEINCAALPETLLESELFGYERGAFTDAKTAKRGLFEVADGGTLFLDEVAELPLVLQAKLLRALDQRRIRRIGGEKEIAVDVRLIAATHADLRHRVKQGSFREDLFYRLNVVPIQIPALRDRGEDVFLLAEHFLAQFSRQYGVSRSQITAEERRRLLAHPWPGNIRELRNAVEQAVLLGEEICPGSDAVSADVTVSRSPSYRFPAPLEAIMREAAHAAVEYFDGNKSEAAKSLQISRKYLYRLLESQKERL